MLKAIVATMCIALMGCSNSPSPHSVVHEDKSDYPVGSGASSVLDRVAAAYEWPSGSAPGVPYQDFLRHALERANPHSVFTKKLTADLMALSRKQDVGETEIRYGLGFPLSSNVNDGDIQEFKLVRIEERSARVFLERLVEAKGHNNARVTFEFMLAKTDDGWRIEDIEKRSFYHSEIDGYGEISHSRLSEVIQKILSRD
ncbi:MAG: hypothetical protein O3A87_07810 [Verrucomicrobia bacterium]|nr:hypothetical protein [Verrucomicrobiota bacterium]